MGIGAHHTTGVAGRDERGHEQPGQHMHQQQQAAPQDPEQGHISAFGNTIEKTSSIGCIDVAYLDQRQDVGAIGRGVVAGFAAGPCTKAEIGFQPRRQRSGDGLSCSRRQRGDCVARLYPTVRRGRCVLADPVHDRLRDQAAVTHVDAGAVKQ